MIWLRREGLQVSTSRVGRILAPGKRRGLLVEPLPVRLPARRAVRSGSYAVRKPRDYQPQRPVDLVPVDTLELRLLPGIIRKQFTARDVVSRWDVLEAHRRAGRPVSGYLAAADALPHPGNPSRRRQQVRRRLGADLPPALFVLPPRSPKLNGRVERAQRTHTEEFDEVTPCSWLIPQLNQELRAAEHTYNTVRPPQALGYLTPQQELLRLHKQQKCH